MKPQVVQGFWANCQRCGIKELCTKAGDLEKLTGLCSHSSCGLKSKLKGTPPHHRPPQSIK